MDLWGNVNLPLYREIENFTSNAWKPVSDREGNIATYGSLIGVPTVGMLSDGISNFSIKARQFDVTCSRNEWRSGIHNDSLWANMTSTWGLAFDMSCTNRTMGNAYPLPILSLSQVNDDSTGSNIAVGSCSVTLNYLETKVTCNGTSCGVFSMRKLDLLRDGYTASLDAFTRGVVFDNMMSFLPTDDNYAVGAASARGSTNAEKWIADPTDSIGSTCVDYLT
jgi:hypothetical protein